MRYFMTIILDRRLRRRRHGRPKASWMPWGPTSKRQIARGALISTGGLKRADDGTRLSGHTRQLATDRRPLRRGQGGRRRLCRARGAGPSRPPSASAAEFVQLHIDNGMPDITVEVRAIDGGYNY